MSAHEQSNHGHHDDGHAHGTFGSYMIGFGLSVILTAIPFALVMTGVLRELMGSKGGEWEILATSAFISIAVPLIVFFAFQRYFVQAMLAG